MKGRPFEDLRRRQREEVMMAAIALSAEEHVVVTSRTTALARSEIVRFSWQHQIDRTVVHNDAHMVDLCLTPRPAGARARFTDVWARNRYERFGGVFLLPAGLTTEARAEAGGDQKSVISWLNPTTLAKWLGEDRIWSDRWLLGALDIPLPRVRHILARIAQELETPGLAGDVMVDLLNMQLAIELGRYFLSLSDQAVGGLAPWRLKRIDERVREGGTPPTLEELAGLVDLSVRQLTRGFRDSRGISIGAYIEERRIGEARRHLEGKRSIKEIAYLLGFATSAGFSYAFRASTGETPRSYRSRTRSALPSIAS
jgi:AraC family transcriptional regulator